MVKNFKPESEYNTEGIMPENKKWKILQKDGYALVLNEGGKTLGVRGDGSGRLIFEDGFAFKDLNGNGTLEPYEDWRLPLEERIRDLVSRMSIEEIAGLMLYSSHQSITRENLMAKMMYPDRDIPDTREHTWDLTEEQRKFVTEDNLRHVLVAMVENTETAARWNNQIQACAEALGLGIPVNISTDPRHTPAITAEFDMGAGGDLSVWPDHIGLAATFDPGIVRQFGIIASKEYRAMGITTALSPQIDLATDPRWNRFTGTFGEIVSLAADMARAYCDGFQTTGGNGEPAWPDAPGWGNESVNAMAKHWPGGGSGESGRDAHYGYGKFAVYPGNNMEEHLAPFINGAFKLEGATKSASAIMPYYTVSWGIDRKNGENVGNSYSKYIITDLLREKYGYDGVVCTDWLITADPGPIDVFFAGKSWGVEKLSVTERHYKILMAGADQFGGNNDAVPVLGAYKMGVAEHGEVFMRERFQLSAKRLLRNIFRTGLFENPYLDAVESRATVGSAEFVKQGYEAQVKSVVMLKNKENVLPLAKKAKIYIPQRKLAEVHDWFGRVTPAREVFPINRALAEQYFTLVDYPAQAEAALCFIESPKCLPYLKDKGYLPINLQYRPYTAAKARQKTIAYGADETAETRSYRGKTAVTENEGDLDMILETKKAMGDKPVIVLVDAKNPFVCAEFEKAGAAILIQFGVQPQVLLDLLTGVYEPSALLPFQMPASMDTVETQAEDAALDMEPHKDEAGNVWDYAFGLNWKGVIQDWRTEKYGG
jgi:beta-glucosidase